jgi:transcriptional regulator with XRE-family HTH domain
MKHIERIRKLRKEKGYNQTFIANEIRVAQTTYSDYEKGKVRIPVECIIKLAQFYDVDLNYITGVSNIQEPFPK